MRLCSTLSSLLLKNSSDGHSTIYIPGKVVPVIDYSHCKKSLSHIKMKYLLVQLVHIVPKYFFFSSSDVVQSFILMENQSFFFHCS